MTILYDHDVFSAQRFGGVSRYFAELMPRLIAMGISVEVFGGFYVSEYARGAAWIRGVHVPAMPFSGTVRRTINNVLQRALVQKSYDIMHLTFCGNFHAKARRRVVTIHDLIPEIIMGQPTAVNSAKKRACQDADHIIAVSYRTKQDLESYFGTNSSKISVIYHGCTLRSVAAAPAPRARPPYMLYVGGRAGYKNFGRLLEAFNHSAAVKRDIDLICFGGGEFTRSERQAISGLGLSQTVHHRSGADSELVALYTTARALVCPSLYEGFGLPVMEAMALGCPVISSNGGALPEISGDASSYFDPYSVEDMAYKIEGTVLDDEHLLGLAKRDLSDRDPSLGIRLRNCTLTSTG